MGLLKGTSIGNVNTVTLDTKPVKLAGLLPATANGEAVTYEQLEGAGADPVFSDTTTDTLLVNSTSVFAGAVSFSSSAKSSSATAGIGYSAGAGGTVTQGTSKATGVTLSKACGAITMNSATLNADVIVSFTLTNTAISATDVLILNHISGGTVGAYHLNAQCAAGSATINVTNISAGNLSEAPVIQFVLIKGVNA